MNKIKVLLAAPLLAAMLCVSAPNSAFASGCEFPAAPGIAGAAVAIMNRVSLELFQKGVKAAWKASLDAVNKALKNAQNDQREALIGCHNHSTEFGCNGTDKDGEFDNYKNSRTEALKGETAQLSASIKDSTRQLGNAMDATNMERKSRELQKMETAARRELTPSDAGCRFDTSANAERNTLKVEKAMLNGVTYDLNRLGNNTAGTVGAAGPGTYTASRYAAYSSVACDVHNNAGKAGCDASVPANNPYANMDVTPSKTFFGQETLKLDDAKTNTVTQELVKNISGYQVPPPIGQDILTTTAGKYQRQQNREALAQMDAVAALPAMIVAERTPGDGNPGSTDANTQIKNQRQKATMDDASSRPSEKEIRQNKIEELWTPKYYSSIGNDPADIARKELYLQAFNIAQLYRLFDKTQKIGMVYAMETGNLLQRTDKSRDSGASQKNTR